MILYQKISQIADKKRIEGLPLGKHKITSQEFAEYVDFCYPNVRFPLMLDGIELEIER